MSVAVLTLAQLRTNTLSAVRARFPGRDTSPESKLGKDADALAGLLWDLHLRVQQADLDATPQAKSTYAALSLWAFTFGLSNGAGGYGPKGAVAATGLTGTATGTNGSVIPNGTQLVAADGSTIYAVVNGPYTIPAAGSILISFNATTAGKSGNANAADTITFVSPPGGVGASVTIVIGSTNGADQESLADLFNRLLSYLQNPPKAITPSDIRSIAEGVSGISRVYLYPRRYGSGSFDLVVVQAGSGQSRDPGEGSSSTSPPTGRLAVLAAINAAKNVAVETARVFRPAFTAGHVILLRVKPSGVSYNFDWNSSVGGWTVSAYVAGPPAVLTLSAAAPLDFQAAVSAGLQPRLQLRTTGLVLPQLVKVTAYNPATFACTLAPVSAAFIAPTVGDVVYAGGPIVATIASAVLALVDSLGPSRASSFANPSDVWSDTLYIDQIRRAALDALDADGVTRLVSSFPASPTIDGLAVDLQAADSFFNAPELLFTKFISVTP